MLSLTDSEVTSQRNRVGSKINQQHATQTDVVIDKTYDRSSNQPAALHASQQEGIGVNKLRLRRELLDERRDGRPEHPEARSHQHGHGVKLP